VNNRMLIIQVDDYLVLINCIRATVPVVNVLRWDRPPASTAGCGI
jgi:hypothetical protein